MKSAPKKVLSAFVAIALALSAWAAPALAEVAEEAMGEEPAQAQATGRGEARGEAAKGAGAEPAPMAEEGAPAEAPADSTEFAAEDAAALEVEAVAGDAAAQAEPEVADVPDEETAADGGPELSTQSVGRLYDPRVVAKSGTESGQVATWDCVWLGSYPQTEVPETDALKNASWEDGDATVGGVRYRRISKDDATNTIFWGDNGTYRYFRYDPIKWRILKVSGSTALAVADVALDCRPYHKELAYVTWEACTVRRWLNGMGGPYYPRGAQSGRTAWGFTSVAFAPDQLASAVRQSTISTDYTRYGITGGNDTTDRVFLLSESEVHGSSATVHGFASSYVTFDEARRCRPTDYARAMGVCPPTEGSYAGNCCWCLRSPGSGGVQYAVDVHDCGYVERGGFAVSGHFAVRPALNLNLSSSYLTWAGTVSSDGTFDASARPGSVRPFLDVPADSWYSGVVYRATKLGLLGGYDSGRFGPNDKITRGQVAVALWNMAGKPAAGAGAKNFSDVKSSDYYYNAVRWASSRGVVSGYGNGKFGPRDNVTREQLAVMLVNYAKRVAGKSVSGSTSDYASMSDGAKVSSWAVPSVGWCFRNKILSGSNGNVLPQGNATRAEAAKTVVGLHDLLG